MGEGAESSGEAGISGIFGSLEPATSPDEAFLKFGDRQAVHGATGDEQQVAADGRPGLILAEDGPETALGAIAIDGGADRSDGGDHPDPDGFRGRLVGGPDAAPEGEGATVQALAALAHGAKIGLPTQVLLRAEAHRRGPAETGIRRP